MNNSSNSAQATKKPNNAVEDTRITKAYHQMEHVVEDRPLSAVMMSFGIGMGVGLAIGSILAAASQPEPKTRAAERMGQQLLDALARVVPSSISDRFNS